MTQVMPSRLEMLRLSKSLSRRELAVETGVSHETIRQIELGGVIEPRMRTARKLASYFGTTPDFLFPPESEPVQQEAVPA